MAAVCPISAPAYGASVRVSGAPPRVHLFDGAAMLLGFTIPNLVMVCAADRKAAWSAALAVHAAAVLPWHFLRSLVMVKAEPDFVAAVTVLPFSTMALVLHGGLAFFGSRFVAPARATGR